MLTISDAARLLGMPEREITDVYESPAGDCITTYDGNTLIVVPADRPDFDGKTGLMFLAAPVLPNGRPYVGGFPVFTNPPEDPALDAVESGETVARDLGVPTKDDLLAQARDLGIEVDNRWGVKRITDAIDEALAAKAAARAALEAEADELEVEGISELDDEALAAAVAAAREQL